MLSLQGGFEFIELLWKICEKRDFFARFSMGSHCTANQRAGGVSTHRYASFSYTSLFSTINIHILKRPGIVSEYGAIVGGCGVDG